MKIDVFSHILPKKYLETYSSKNKEVLESIEARTRPVTDLDVRRGSRIKTILPGI